MIDGRETTIRVGRLESRDDHTKVERSDLGGLLTADVLDISAYDEAGNRLFVTGEYWR